MARTAIQLYTLRDVDSDLEDLLEIVSDAGFDAVEFAGRETNYEPEEVATMLSRTGLEAAGAHVGIETLEEDPGGTIERYEAMGCTDLVVPWLDPEHFESQEAVAAAATKLAAVSEALTGSDCTLHYHNHTQEFNEIEGGNSWDAFVAATEIGIELDVGHVARAGHDPVERLRALGDRAELVHFADVNVEADESVPLGEGDVDLEACAEAAHEVGADWFIYEYEGEEPMATLDTVAQRLMNLA